MVRQFSQNVRLFVSYHVWPWFQLARAGLGQRPISFVVAGLLVGVVAFAGVLSPPLLSQEASGVLAISGSLVSWAFVVLVRRRKRGLRVLFYSLSRRGLRWRNVLARLNWFLAWIVGTIATLPFGGGYSALGWCLWGVVGVVVASFAPWYEGPRSRSSRRFPSQRNFHVPFWLATWLEHPVTFFGAPVVFAILWTLGGISDASGPVRSLAWTALFGLFWAGAPQSYSRRFFCLAEPKTLPMVGVLGLPASLGLAFVLVVFPADALSSAFAVAGTIFWWDIGLPGRVSPSSARSSFSRSSFLRF